MSIHGPSFDAAQRRHDNAQPDYYWEPDDTDLIISMINDDLEKETPEQFATGLDVEHYALLDKIGLLICQPGSLLWQPNHTHLIADELQETIERFQDLMMCGRAPEMKARLQRHAEEDQAERRIA